MGEVRPLLMNKTNGRTRTQGCDSIVEWNNIHLRLRFDLVNLINIHLRLKIRVVLGVFSY